jgi:NTP pyrophosphatase (non-canonical NTP hydrolase)
MTVSAMSTSHHISYAHFVESRTKELGNVALNLHHATTGMAGESGEALDITKKLWIYNQTPATTNKEGVTNFDHLIEELGDTLFYVQMACNHLGVTMEHVIGKNVAKLEKRYPTGYTDAAAAQRADKEKG